MFPHEEGGSYTIINEHAGCLSGQAQEWHYLHLLINDFGAVNTQTCVTQEARGPCDSVLDLAIPHSSLVTQPSPASHLAFDFQS